MDKLSSVGRITKLFGAEGELVATLYNTFPDDFNKKEPLFVKIDGLAVPLFLSRFNRRGRTGAVVSFDDIDTRVRAEELLGMEILLPEVVNKVDERDDDEFLFEDLVGFTAIINTSTRGIIEEYIDNPMNPLFVVSVEGKEVLIPANEEFFCSFNIDKAELGFDLPNGLLELYTQE